ncbi:MAG: NGG1p interacting factor NIF3 [Gammaproteobacteria bacterium]|nr:NGG1p interacting factor NIF3 [Gammaproteobacteria bacterium]
MLKLVFFVPETHKETVKTLFLNKGLGVMTNYDYCSWETLGTGQFRPLSASSPFLGQKNQLETVEEYRVEMICSEQTIKAVLNALIDAHPYETPAYEVQSIKTLDDF